jgi:hypothetical protein
MVFGKAGYAALAEWPLKRAVSRQNGFWRGANRHHLYWLIVPPAHRSDALLAMAVFGQFDDG